MQPYEVSVLLEYIENADRLSWEQTRLQMYMVAQVNSTKKLKPTDILPFSWDKEKRETDTSISNEDIARLTERAKQLEKIYSQKK